MSPIPELHPPGAPYFQAVAAVSPFHCITYDSHGNIFAEVLHMTKQWERHHCDSWCVPIVHEDFEAVHYRWKCGINYSF